MCVIESIVLHFRIGYVLATYVRHLEHCTALSDRLCPDYICASLRALYCTSGKAMSGLHMCVIESIVLHFRIGYVRTTYVRHWEHCTALPGRLCPGYICASLRALYCTSGKAMSGLHMCVIESNVLHFRIGYVRATYMRHWEHCTALPGRLCPGYMYICASLRALHCTSG